MWPERVRDVFVERLAAADELHLDASPGSEAWSIALREARRVAAGIPDHLRRSREPDLLDIVLEKFAPLGDMRCVAAGPAEESEKDEFRLAISREFEVRVERSDVGS